MCLFLCVFVVVVFVFVVVVDVDGVLASRAMRCDVIASRAKTTRSD